MFVCRVHPSAEYSPQQFNQLVRSLEQVILQLNSTFEVTFTENKDQAQTWFLGN
jgi:hypothetical protein